MVGKKPILILGVCLVFCSASRSDDSKPRTDIFVAGNPAVMDSIQKASTDWQRVLDPTGKSPVDFGVTLLGPSPYAENEKKYFPPASLSKYFTSLAALHYFGPEHRFETQIRWEVLASQPKIIQNLKLVGASDPSWGMTEFGETLKTRLNRIAQILVRRGVTQVNGPIQIVAEDPRWEQLEYPAGWDSEDRTECYGALPQSFNLDLNCALYKISGVGKGGWITSGVDSPVQLAIVKSSRTSLRLESQGRKIIIRGTWKSGTAPLSLYLPVLNTQGWIKNTFIRVLAENKIAYVPNAPRPGTRILAQAEVDSSPPLSEILKPFMKKSLNMIGETLLRHLGRSFGEPGQPLLAAGQGVLREFVAQIGEETATRAGVSPIHGFFSDQVDLLDGSGLSRNSKVTPNALMILLNDALLEARKFPVLWETLPIAGVDGTLASRMKNTSAQGVLRAKTGTLSGVYHLAGFVPKFSSNDSSRMDFFVPFVVLSTVGKQSSSEARQAQDRVGVKLSELINPELQVLF